MGYRFSLESANTVANLIFGEVYTCYKEIISSPESLWGFIDFLDRYRENMYTNDQRQFYIIDRIRDVIHYQVKHYDNYKRFEDNSSTRSAFLDSLQQLSNLFRRCKIKTLLLPSTNVNNECAVDLTSRALLRDLVHLHPRDTCLILQPEEVPRKITIFNAFPNFDIALQQADEWPAIFFWQDEENYAFVPVRRRQDIFELFEVIKYEVHPINLIKLIAEQKRSTCHYLFQLSDLHFGARNMDVAGRRISKLLELQIAKLDQRDSIRFVITGDTVDSPSQTAENTYLSFSEFLQEKSGESVIRVLGNHDINPMGLAFLHDNQQTAQLIGAYPKIEILDNPKVILLLFNSNTNGNFAQGEIGARQMSEMGNQLDKIKNLNEYLLIAVLHHHVIPIPKPDFYDKKWYEKIIPNTIMDNTLKLNDADIFLEWLRARNVKFVLHGHKHIPFIGEKDGIHVISCGSSTGKIQHREKGKTYLSYNVIKLSPHSLTCSQFAEDIMGAGEKNIYSQTIKF